MGKPQNLVFSLKNLLICNISSHCQTKCWAVRTLSIFSKINLLHTSFLNGEIQTYTKLRGNKKTTSLINLHDEEQGEIWHNSSHGCSFYKYLTFVFLGSLNIGTLCLMIDTKWMLISQGIWSMFRFKFWKIFLKQHL